MSQGGFCGFLFKPSTDNNPTLDELMDKKINLLNQIDSSDESQLEKINNQIDDLDKPIDSLIGQQKTMIDQELKQQNKDLDQLLQKQQKINELLSQELYYKKKYIKYKLKYLSLGD